MKRERIHLVTGKLASRALDEVMQSVSAELDVAYTIDVLPITVAGLMTPAWVARHIAVPDDTDRVLLPGYCVGDLEPLHQKINCPIVLGPKDLRELPQFLGAAGSTLDDYGRYQIQIIAEINHAPR